MLVKHVNESRRSLWLAEDARSTARNRFGLLVALLWWIALLPSNATAADDQAAWVLVLDADGTPTRLVAPGNLADGTVVTLAGESINGLAVTRVSVPAPTDAAEEWGARVRQAGSLTVDGQAVPVVVAFESTVALVTVRLRIGDSTSVGREAYGAGPALAGVLPDTSCIDAVAPRLPCTAVLDSEIFPGGKVVTRSIPDHVATFGKASRLVRVWNDAVWKTESQPRQVEFIKTRCTYQMTFYTSVYASRTDAQSIVRVTASNSECPASDLGSWSVSVNDAAARIRPFLTIGKSGWARIDWIATPSGRQVEITAQDRNGNAVTFEPRAVVDVEHPSVSPALLKHEVCPPNVVAAPPPPAAPAGTATCDPLDRVKLSQVPITKVFAATDNYITIDGAATSTSESWEVLGGLGKGCGDSGSSMLDARGQVCVSPVAQRSESVLLRHTREMPQNAKSGDLGNIVDLGRVSLGTLNVIEWAYPLPLRGAELICGENNGGRSALRDRAGLAKTEDLKKCRVRIPRPDYGGGYGKVRLKLTVEFRSQSADAEWKSIYSRDWKPSNAHDSKDPSFYEIDVEIAQHLASGESVEYNRVRVRVVNQLTEVDYLWRGDAADEEFVEERRILPGFAFVTRKTQTTGVGGRVYFSAAIPTLYRFPPSGFGAVASSETKGSSESVALRAGGFLALEPWNFKRNRAWIPVNPSLQMGVLAVAIDAATASDASSLWRPAFVSGLGIRILGTKANDKVETFSGISLWYEASRSTRARFDGDYHGYETAHAFLVGLTLAIATAEADK